MIEMTVIGLTLDPKTGQPIVVLKDNENLRGLPIWIGHSEAKAISIALYERRTERPLTHLLLTNILELLEYEVERIEIDLLDRTTYKATIVLNSTSADADLKFVDARPSDAIAVALNAKAPILVSKSLEFVVNDELQLELSFKEFLKDVKASDFNLCTNDRLKPEGWDLKNVEVETGTEGEAKVLEIHTEIDSKIRKEIDSQTQAEYDSEFRPEIQRESEKDIEG